MEMLMGVLRVLITLFLFLQPLRTLANTNNMNVILVTLDGVRWQNVFGNDGEFPYMRNNLAQEGVLIGDPASDTPMRVSNSMNVSLPAYHSIMLGQSDGCWTNLCGRVSSETFEERLVRELKFQSKDVATIASWNRIAYAVEHIEHYTTVNAGPSGDEESPPWDDARYDKYTFAFAMRYMQTFKPRFLYIALNDSDEWAHKGNYAKYSATLKQYDAWIQELVSTLDQMSDYKENTLLLITTDHGRGNDQNWTSHGPFLSESKNIWFFARSAATRRHSVQLPHRAYSHADIRPTIEAAFGLTPKKCDDCGSVIDGLLD